MSDILAPFFDPYAHAAMIRDGIRLKAFRSALQLAVRPDDVVVDLGTGTGILAAFAAKLGAKKVIAIERGPMIDVARAVVAENGLADVIELVHKDVRDIDVAALRPDVVISETIGPMAYDQNILGLVGQALLGLDPRPRVVPTRLALSLVGLEDIARHESLEGLAEIEGVRLGALRTQLVRRVWTQRIRTKEILTEPIEVASTLVGADPLPPTFAANLEVTRPGLLNSLSGFWHATLFEGVTLTNAPFGPRLGWSNYRFLVDPPIPCKAGDRIAVQLSLVIISDDAGWSWHVSLGSEQRQGGVKPIGQDRDRWLHALASSPANGSASTSALLADLLGEAALDPAAAAKALAQKFPERYANEDAASTELKSLLTNTSGSII